MSFGIKRVVVPEQEIKQYLAYRFAEQAARQLMFNNFRQGEGKPGLFLRQTRQRFRLDDDQPVAILLHDPLLQ